MRGVNKVILMGNLGADPELRVTTTGKAVTNLRLATSKSFKVDGELVTRTEWHNLVAWERAAELLAEYARKGTRLYVEGELQTRKWEDQEGNDRYTTEVVVREFSLESPRQDDGDEPEPAAKAAPKARTRKAKAEPAPALEFGPEDEEIPF